ncbi:hypothetical protein AAMO2058_001596300 [Amorphochlora amoebiformis]
MKPTYRDELKINEEIIRTTQTDESYFAYRYWLVSLALLQSFLAAGIFYGWPSLYTMLLEEGIYNNRCPHPPKVCAEQTLDLGFIYTIGGCSNLGAQLLWGWILDRKGPRVCSFLSVAMVFCGIILLGVTDNKFDVLPHAMVLIAVGGPGASISCFHLSNLFPQVKNTVLSLFSGAFQLGFMVFMVFRSLIPYLNRFQICVGYAVILFIIILAGLAVWPERSLTKPREVDDIDPAPKKVRTLVTNSPSFMRINQYSDPTKRLTSVLATGPSIGSGAQSNVSREGSFMDSPQDTPPNHARATSLYRVDSDILQFASVATPTVRRQVKRKKPLLWKQVLSVPFAFLTLWMSVGLFWMNFYIGNVADQMFSQANGERAPAHQYTAYFTTILPLGAVAIPIYGSSTDRFGLPFAVVLSTIFGALFTSLCVIHDLRLQIATFVCYSLFRTFVFATFFSLVAKEFGYSSFGVLSGLILFIAGAICLFQYPVRRYGVPNGDFDGINTLQMLFVTVTGLSFSLYICVHLYNSRPASIKRRQDSQQANLVQQPPRMYGSTDSFKRPLTQDNKK